MGHLELLFIYLVQENLKVETLRKQYEIVRKETNTSHVEEYGDLVSVCHHSGLNHRDAADINLYTEIYFQLGCWLPVKTEF